MPTALAKPSADVQAQREELSCIPAAYLLLLCLQQVQDLAGHCDAASRFPQQLLVGIQHRGAIKEFALRAPGLNQLQGWHMQAVAAALERAAVPASRR